MFKFCLILATFVVASYAEFNAGYCYSECSATAIKIEEITQKCSADYGEYNKVRDHLDQLTHALLKKSYDFLLLAAKFEEFALNKPGMNKLYKGISDKAWKDTIDLIKYQSKRGHKVAFVNKYNHLEESLNSTQPKLSNNTNIVKEIKTSDDIIENSGANSSYIENSGANVLKSLAYTLDYEKNIAQGIHHIHRILSIAGKKDSKKNSGGEEYHYDPEVTQFLEEKFIEDEADHIRKLAGYVTDVKKLLLQPDGKQMQFFAMEIFDNYLAKQ